MRPTIIVPLTGQEVDPDGVAEGALPLALGLAERTGAPVVLISVLEKPMAFVNLATALDVAPGEDDRGIATRRAYLEQVAARYPGRVTQTFVRVGNPADRILQLANSLPDPLIVMASRGRAGAARMLLGSVAFRVVHEARCPVVVVRTPEEGKEAAPVRPLRRVLVPLDGSAVAEWALDRALAMLGEPDFEIQLLHVVEPFDRLSALAAYEYASTTEEWATSYLQEITERLARRGYRAHAVVRTGQVAAEIARAAQVEEIDLIAMATHGRSGLSRVVFGSVAERLVHEIATPLLLVRPDAKTIAESAQAPIDQRAGAPAPAPSRPVTARDIMTRPVIVVREETTLEEVARAMLKHKIGSVLVMDAREQLVGIITESDFTGEEQGVPFSAYRAPHVFGMWLPPEGVERIYEAGRTLTASTIMSSPVTTVTEDEPIGAVIERMIRQDLKRIPVVRNGRPVGIVSRHDLLKLMVRERGEG